jgi:lysophospholipase L1-like esterase
MAAVKRRWLAIALGMLVLGLLVAATLGAGEAWIRYRERTRATVPGTTPLLYYRHHRLPHALARNADYFGWIQTNRWGFRGPDVPHTPLPGTIRIMTVGASTTFDTQTSGNDHTWPAQLASYLGDSESMPLEIINAGVPGYTVLDNLIRLETELHYLRPDVIILYHAHNDLFGALASARRSPAQDTPPWARPGEIPVTYPWVRWLEHNSLLFTKLEGRFQAIRFLVRGRRASADSSSSPDWNRVLTDGAAQFRHDLRTFLAVAQSQGIRVALPHVVHVAPLDTLGMPAAVREWWQRAVPFAPVDVVLAGYKVYNQVLLEVAEEYQQWHLPLDESRLGQLDAYAEGDPIHFNDVGARLMAEELAVALRVAGILNVPQATRAHSPGVGNNILAP